MPHPSNPLDDIRAGSLYREHGPSQGLEDVWLVSGAAPAKDALDSGQRAQRLSDGLSYLHICINYLLETSTFLAALPCVI